MGRQIVGAVVAPSREGGALLESGGRKALSGALREGLARYFAAVVLPRKWRFVEALPVNEQGKLRKDLVRALFEPSPKPYEILSTDAADGSIELVLRFPEDSPFFDGHFPAFKLLPAVAQIDIVMRLAAERLGSSMEMEGMPRVKFQKPIVPRAEYGLRLEYDASKARIGFEYTEVAAGESCSSGKIDLRPRP
jgi:3-hydroxymyristoyl/3-hydroxydecanoyl-(acyl carrier protein) dehydratase